MKGGAAARTADAVMALYETRYPTERIAQPAWFLLWCFSQLWRFGSANDLRSKRARTKRLPVPVVSIGNITAGGTGKTPLTLELLHDLAGLKPAVLTRGHGRNTTDTVLLPRGDEHAPIERTGDEAQLYLRSAHVPIGIGTERAEAGARLLEDADVRVFLLDDGLQHVQLHRDFDLVVVDALRPFGGGHPLPLGRLREPLSALGRADAFVITRSRAVANLPAIIATLRTWNPAAPVYPAWLENRQWCNGRGATRQVHAMAGSKSIAFCGLGNPESFWRSLADLGVTPMEEHSYGDHHRYTPNELRRLARHAQEIGADYLLTTAKDSVNLGDYETVTSPLEVWWLEIGVGIEGRDDLVARIRQRVTG
jgi:tetraacyldisaccharide 4'-kinase